MFTWISLILLVWGIPSRGEAQLNARFGKNKVHYKDFNWATLKTEHFVLYFYRAEETLARNTEKMAERAYQYLSSTFNHQFSEKIPLIIYASSDDFQQTEVIAGFLGEGIGGVTESLKGRIVIPFLGSYRSFNHVLIHELVHAFQFDVLSAGGPALGGGSSGLSVPLWFIEGMAEYLSEYTNPLTAMWLQDAVDNDTLPKAKKIESMRDIRVYRFGQALWEYICDTYGEQIIGDILRELAKTESWGKAIQKTADTSWKTIYNEWLEMVKTTYGSHKPGMHSISAQARLLISHKKDEFFLNIIPAVSPDGKYVAFLSDRDFYRTIYLASAESGEVIKTLVEGERRGTFETLRFLNTSITWSPDSQHIAFNAKAGGENAIYMLNIHSRKIVKKLAPELTSLSFLAWSPTDDVIALTGTINGQEDLFLLDIKSEKMSQLTNDLYSNRHPSWSPDGRAIAFSTDAGQFSDSGELKFGPSNLAIYERASGKSSLLTDNAVNDFTPTWSPDGKMLAFISDRSGLCNIYLLELAKNTQAERTDFAWNVIQLTNVNTGVVGLTEDNPALTWASETGKLLFSGFSNKGWDIFALENPAREYREYLAEVGFEEEQLPEVQESIFLENFGKKDWAYTHSQEAKPEVKDYEPRLKPDYILGGGGGNDKDFVILARLGFSDMLSNHRLTIGVNFIEVFDESDFLIRYSNRSRRLSYELLVFQFGDETGTYSMKNDELDIEVQRGTGVNFRWPFDKFKRLEFGLEGWMVSGERVEGDERKEMQDYFFIEPSLAYVHDTALYTPLGPLDGRRSRFSLHPAIGDFTYLTLAADQRWYLRATRRSVLAFRLLTVTSLGENARIFKIGGSNTFRAGEFDDEDKERIEGARIALSNIEYRFPLLPKINFLRGNIFWDMGLGWSDSVQLFTTENTDFLRLKDLRAAYGAGIRIPISVPFGIINFRLDIAQETDLTHNIGHSKILFSLGNDF